MPDSAEFDAFWDGELERLAALPLECELRESSFRTPVAECQDLYFTGIRSARIHAKYLKSSRDMGRGPRRMLLMFHGYSRSSGPWHEKLAYAASGFDVLAMDCRGQGGISMDSWNSRGQTYHGYVMRGVLDGPQNLYYHDVYLDAVRLAHIAQELAGREPVRIATFGDSQGAALALVCASLVPQVEKVVALSPFLCDIRKVVSMGLSIPEHEEVRTHFRDQDPERKGEDTILDVLEYIDVVNFVPRIRGAVLFGTGLLDAVCPPSSQSSAFDRIQSKKERRIYPDFRHELIPAFYEHAYGFLVDPAEVDPLDAKGENG